MASLLTGLASLPLGGDVSPLDALIDQDEVLSDWSCSACGSVGVYRASRRRMRPAFLGADLQCTVCMGQGTVSVRVRTS